MNIINYCSNILKGELRKFITQQAQVKPLALRIRIGRACPRSSLVSKQLVTSKFCTVSPVKKFQFHELYASLYVPCSSQEIDLA